MLKGKWNEIVERCFDYDISGVLREVDRHEIK